MPEFDIVRRWRGRVLRDPERNRIGTIVELYYDAETDEPGWALCNAADIGRSMRLVPLGQAVEDGGAVRLPFDRASVTGAPGMEPGDRVGPQEEAADDEIVPLSDAVGAARWRWRAGR